MAVAGEGSMDALTDALRSYEPVKWSAMPDLELYMDQVITYLKRQLSLFQDASEGSLITPSIINNYVKDGIVPRPINKRYAREQLSALTMACVLKRVLPMQRVKQLTAHGEGASEARYEAFSEALKGMLAAEADGLRDAGDQELTQMAMDYALRACADCLIADRLLSMIKDKDGEVALDAEDKRARKKNRNHD